MATHHSLQKSIFDDLAELPNEPSRIRFIAHQGLFSKQFVKELDEAVTVQLRVDLKKAHGLAEAALTIANKLDDKESRAYALRAKANVLWFLRDNRQASELHAQAVELFEKVGSSVEAGRTLSTSIQPLILLGEYARASAAAARAREIFLAAGETLRLARLQINIGNILHRQDRFREALDCYEQAYAQISPDKDPEGIVVALHNIAMCLTMLHEDENALRAYEQVLRFCKERAMPLATAQTEYNIAYLSFLKGRYGHAIELLRTTYKASQKAGDAYRAALCHLDLSEIYLELNLNQEAEDLAQQALTSFESLGVEYEAAKARCQSAMALGQQGKTFRSLMSFAQARTAFAKEKNPVWPSLIDLYQAMAYFNDGRIEESRRYCIAALNFFRDSPLRGRAILCRLLLARLSLNAGETAAARRECESALAELTGMETPILVYQAQLVMGRIEEAAGNLEEAENRYRAAKDVLETLRCGLYGEELKISFLENKLEVYENLVELYLARDSTPETREDAWICMEQAKSRSLLELIATEANSRISDQPGDTNLALRVTALREKLNWHYHRIEVEELAQEPASSERLSELRQLATQVEKELVRLSRELSSERPQDRGGDAAAPISLELTREALGPDTTLIEYFRTRDKILAAVITQRNLDVVEITTASRIAESLDMLRFQFMKPRLGMAYVRRFQQSLLDATQARLHDLYKELLGPVRDKLKGKHLIVVPHQSLHRVPFHALFDGEAYLADSFSISYAPSASIYVQCRRRPSSLKRQSLILGILSPDAPQISDEVRLVEAAAPNPKVLLGSDASEAALRQHGPQSNLIHIATHGLFREDSPMFSRIRLGDTFLTPYDLYRLALPVDQITLSCCSTGLSVVTAGDEVMGLTRGLLCAGAKSLLLSLWDVNDTSTATFMNVFYSRFFSGQNRALAFQGAIQDLRQLYPHPYYWAPFVLVGDIS